MQSIRTDSHLVTVSLERIQEVKNLTVLLSVFLTFPSTVR